MKKFLLVCSMLAALIGLAVPPANAYQKDCLASLVTPTWLEGQSVPCSVRLDGGEGFHFLDQLGGEHIGATEGEGYIRVRGDFVPSAQVSTDTQIKATPGHVSHMTCYGTDAAAVAGTIILYDNTAESGTILQAWTVAALDYHTPITFPIMANAATGIYLGFTTTTDVNCTVFYR